MCVFRVKSLNCLLNIKEESLRKLREILRKSQQEQQESCKNLTPSSGQISSSWQLRLTDVVTLVLQGEALYGRLTNPRGSAVQTSGLLERAKLEQEVVELQR